MSVVPKNISEQNEKTIKINFINKLIVFLMTNKIIFGLLALIIISAVISPYFLTVKNIFNVLRQLSVMGTISIGMTYVILTGGIDLSVGAIVAVSCVVSGVMLVNGYGALMTIITVLFIGVVTGLLNGWVIVRFKLEPFVVTLGTSVILQGMALVIPNGRTVILDKPSDFIYSISNGFIGVVPIAVILTIIFYIIGHFILGHTIFGRHVYAIGSNEEATRLSGINVSFNKIAVYVLSGFTAAIAGILFFSRVNVGDPTAGANLPLDSIAAVVVGGTRFVGAIGGVGYTVIGVLIIGLINNILNLVGVSPYMQYVVRGVIILLAVVAGAPKKTEG